MSATSFFEQEFVKQLTEIIEANLHNEQFGVSELALKMGMSRVSLHRKIKSAINTSASQFICQVRLKKALELLKQNTATVSETAYDCGFHSVSYFSKCFHDYYGYTPGEVGKQNESETIPIDKPNKKRPVIIVSSVFFIVLIFVVLFVLVKPFLFQQKELEKTIAVLPFIDDSPEEGNMYIINGLIDEIIIKLENIDELHVKSRTDSEKFRESNKSIKQIGRELNVNYILEGSGQVINSEIVIRLQLIEVNSGNHVWSHDYIKDIEDIFELQEDVAISVASKLKAKLSPEEIEKIEKRPTENLVAYNLYLKGKESLGLAMFNPKWGATETEDYVQKAKYFFQLAIEEDYTYSEAYEVLAHIYLTMLRKDVIELRNRHLDSALIMANKALLYDANNANAYARLQAYYNFKGMRKEANYAKEKVLELKNLTSKDWEYHWRNFWDHNSFEEYFYCLESFFKYQEMKPENELVVANTLMFVIQNLCHTGYPEQAKKYALEILNQTKDSLTYFSVLEKIEIYSCNLKNALVYSIKTNERDPSVSFNSWIILNYNITMKEHAKALEIMQEMIEKTINSGDTIIPNLKYGYVYLKNGFEKESVFHFEGHKKILQQEIFYNTANAQSLISHANLAAIYSVTGDKEKALHYLLQIKNRKTIPYVMLWHFNNFCLLDNIRSEPEFQEILADVDAKYQKEHLRVGELLRDFGEIE